MPETLTPEQIAAADLAKAEQQKAHYTTTVAAIRSLDKGLDKKNKNAVLCRKVLQSFWNAELGGSPEETTSEQLMHLATQLDEAELEAFFDNIRKNHKELQAGCTDAFRMPGSMFPVTWVQGYLNPKISLKNSEQALRSVVARIAD